MEYDRNPRMLNGYRVVYKPNHFNHTLNDKGYKGYVYEHRYVVEVEIGRPLYDTEIIHHKDGNKLNNNIDNLEITDRVEHAKKHHEIYEPRYCIDCGVELKDKRNKRCRKCSRINSRKVRERPSKEDLLDMLSKESYCAVARKFGVSDNAIRKWLR